MFNKLRNIAVSSYASISWSKLGQLDLILGSRRHLVQEACSVLRCAVKRPVALTQLDPTKDDLDK